LGWSPKPLSRVYSLLLSKIYSSSYIICRLAVFVKNWGWNLVVRKLHKMAIWTELGRATFGYENQLIHKGEIAISCPSSRKKDPRCQMRKEKREAGCGYIYCSLHGFYPF
jgi:hypothetical protein